MKHFPHWIVAFAAVALPAAPAQQSAAPPASINIILKDGRTINTAQALGRSGKAVMVTVPMGGGQQGQLGYEVSNILRIEFPEPPQIKLATDLLAAGNINQSLAELAPVLKYYDQFRDVPGSWWPTAAMIEIEALTEAGRAGEVEALVGELVDCQGNPEAMNLGKVHQAEAIARRGGYEAALQTFDAVIGESRNKGTLAQAWLYKGESLYALRRLEPAILAYLHVPVFYPEQKLLMPRAMLGGAKAMVELRDRKSARDQLDDLVKNYPASPQANEAKTELDALDKAQNPKP